MDSNLGFVLPSKKRTEEVVFKARHGNGQEEGEVTPV